MLIINNDSKHDNLHFSIYTRTACCAALKRTKKGKNVCFVARLEMSKYYMNDCSAMIVRAKDKAWSRFKPACAATCVCADIDNECSNLESKPPSTIVLGGVCLATEPSEDFKAR